MYPKCLDLAWLIVDEDSAIGCELLAALENTTTRAIRKRGTDKLRNDGSVRPFGGINVLFCGDWWQLPPVLQTSLTANPFKDRAASVQKMQAMF